MSDLRAPSVEHDGAEPHDGAGFRRAAWFGSIVGTVGWLWVLTHARWRVFSPARTLGDSILSAQAHAWLHGRWNLDPRVLGIEAFKIDGEYHTYFGPVPSLLRLPVVAFTDRFDARLGIASMTLALAVVLVATASLHRRIREFVRPGAPLGRGELVVVGAVQCAVAMGSVVTFLGSHPLVYHEMELWGIAGALTTAVASLAFIASPSVRSAAACGAAAAMTIGSRPSVGFGAVCTVGVLALVQFRRGWRSTTTVAIVLATALPLVAYAAVNVARFGAPFSLPLDKQVFTTGDPALGIPPDAHRQATLAANGGSLFGLRFAPTTALQYARPDAVRLDATFPWVNFPHWRAHVVGDAVFDTIDRSSSIPASMPAWTLFAVVGVVALALGRTAGTRRARAVLPALLGGVVGTAFVLTIAYVAQRYLADFFPPVLVAALVGLQVCALVRRRAFVACLAVIAVVGCWPSFALARQYQRPLSSTDPDYGRGVDTSTSR